MNSLIKAVYISKDSNRNISVAVIATGAGDTEVVDVRSLKYREQGAKMM